MPFLFDPGYAGLRASLVSRIRPTPVRRPSWLAWNERLAEQLGADAAQFASAETLQALAGNAIPKGAEPMALAYAGHQFGHFVPQLGDGRAILLGEVVGRDGRRVDVQLKGAGPTPFSRGGDGRAALGPVLREYVVSEAMAALGVPTTRALAAVSTGEPVYREAPLPGAVLTRVASSHLRIGTFQYFATRRNHAVVSELVQYALRRHYPDAPAAPHAALSLLESVMTAQAKLVASWLSLGFVHGVMNTDNMSIAGETLDYGPCAFLDTYDPQRTFSSIDRGGRYAFMNQPRIALWNLTRFAETLLPLLPEFPEQAAAILTERLETFVERFESAYEALLARKLGFSAAREGDTKLFNALFALMAEGQVDFTLCFRRLTEAVRDQNDDRVAELFPNRAGFAEWAKAWHQRHDDDTLTPTERLERMRLANPAFIPRNHRIEEMITAATNGDMVPFERLMRVLARPYEDQEDAVDLQEPPGNEQWSYRTFCGT